MSGPKYQSREVFGISTDILLPSYVDRGNLDASIKRLLLRDTHIALRGESKCGKSWLRQKNLPDAITVQCRLNKTARNLYVDALSQLGLQLITERSAEKGYKGRLEATQEFGAKILAIIYLTKQTLLPHKMAWTSPLPALPTPTLLASI